MGHIAEALKKAERERRERKDLGHGAGAYPRTGMSLTARARPLSAVAPRARSGAIPPKATDAPYALIADGDGAVATLNTLESIVHSPLAAGAAPARPARHSGSDIGVSPGPAGGSLAWDVDPAVVAVCDRGAAVTEQFRAIRTWLLSRAKPTDRMCLAITSSVPREGKSIAAANLAVVLAEVRQRRVLLVDCDVRKSDLARFLRLPERPGLIDVLAGRCGLDEAIVTTPLGNLSVLPAGRLDGENPTELLNSTAAIRVFDEIRDAYDYCLVDTPPVQRVADVGVIGALCSGVLMVVRMHKTASNLVRESVRWLQANHLNVVGCIATGCSPRDATYGDAMADDDDK